MKPTHSHSPREQQGATLIVALIFLAILALLGATAAQTTQLEERMASNTRDRDRALQASEAALSWASRNMATLSATPATVPTGNVANNAVYWNAFNWSGPGTTQLTGANIAVVGLASYPQIAVERRGGIGPPNNYRVTVRGVGANASTVVILQAEYTYP